MKLTRRTECKKVIYLSTKKKRDRKGEKNMDLSCKLIKIITKQKGICIILCQQQYIMNMKLSIHKQQPNMELQKGDCSNFCNKYMSLKLQIPVLVMYDMFSQLNTEQQYVDTI